MISREELNKNIQLEIDDDYKKERNKKIVIFLFKLFSILFVIFFVGFMYIENISTKSIIVKEKRIINKNIPSSFDGTKIMHFSDLYYNSNNINLNKLVSIINVRKPDLVIFTGNLLDSKKISNKDEEKLINSLSNISSTIGKYAILTKNDNDISKIILKQSGFIFLEDTSEVIYNNDNSPILLSFYNSDINKTFEYLNGENVNKDMYKILLLENPDDIEKVKNYNVNLALSGRSLNGQICLYSDLCFKKFEGAKKYYKEYYKIDNTKLFISSGIGTPNNSYRFMARPSINFFRLSSK